MASAAIVVSPMSNKRKSSDDSHEYRITVKRRIVEKKGEQEQWIDHMKKQIEEVITIKNMCTYPWMCEFVLDKMKEANSRITNDEIKYEKDVHTGESMEERLERAHDKEEWVEWPIIGTPSIQDVVCVNPDCYYKGNPSAVHNLKLFRLKATRVFVCNVCLKNMYNTLLTRVDVE